MNSISETWTEIKMPPNSDKKKEVSIVIAFRNEEKFLERLLHSIEALNYPRDCFEVILVNDHSSDSSLQIITEISEQISIQMKCFSLGEGERGKKTAIERGVHESNYPLIITTDADCLVPLNWLNSIVVNAENASFVSSPVAFEKSQKWFSAFVELDFLSLIGLGGVLVKEGKPFLANGANMAFCKSDFVEIGGYKGNKNYSSGDDVFLLSSMLKASKRIVFNKSPEAIVTTQMPQSLFELFNQRIRWAKKTQHINSLSISWKIYLMLLAYLGFVISPIVLFICYSNVVLGLVVFSWFLKLLVDFKYFKRLTTFFNRTYLMRQLLWVEILHPFYVVFIGLLSLFVPYKWKLRIQKDG